MVEVSLGNKASPYVKNNPLRRGGIAQVPNKQEVLSSTPGPTKNKIKITNVKRACRVAQVVEHLPNKCGTES
jgi:hypothetical protein